MANAVAGANQCNMPACYVGAHSPQPAAVLSHRRPLYWPPRQLDPRCLTTWNKRSEGGCIPCQGNEEEHVP